MRLGRRRWLGVSAGAIAGGLIGGTVPAQAAPRKLTFEIYKDRTGEFRWRLKAANGQVIATGGQGYKAKADCRKGIEVIQQGASEAAIVDATAEK